MEPGKWPTEWMAAAAAVLAFLGWAKKQAGWQVLVQIAAFFSKARRGRNRLQVQHMRELSMLLSRTLRESHGVRANAICLHNGGGDITASGARGFEAFCEVMDLTHDEPLTDGQTVNVVLKPTDHEESGVLIEPDLIATP